MTERLSKHASKQGRGRAEGRNWEAEIDTNTLRILCTKQVTDENIVYGA